MLRSTAIPPTHLSVLVALLMAFPLSAAEQPRMATVRVADAALRSGPGESYYMTAQLSAGTAVEVYRMTQGGWCGIRPTEGSFSYVRTNDVNVSEDDATILVNHVAGAKTHVGSQLTADHSVTYIALRDGERLKKVGGPVLLGNQRWYRVSPPSGEFRWIHLDDLELEKEGPEPTLATPNAKAFDAEMLAAVASGKASKQSMATEPIQAKPKTVHVPLASTPPNAEASETEPAEPSTQGTWRAVTRDAPARPAPRTWTTAPIRPTETTTDEVAQVTTTEEVAQLPGPPAEDIELAAQDSHEDIAGQNSRRLTVQPATFQATNSNSKQLSEPIGVMTPSVPSPASNASTPKSLTTEVVNGATPLVVAELDLALAKIVAQEVNQWELSGLKQKTELLIQKASDPLVRTHAEAILQRIAEFTSIQQRHQDLIRLSSPHGVSGGERQMSPANTAQARNVAVDLTQVVANDANVVGKSGSQVSVKGWLVPVESARTDVPRFALTSDDGEILYFVSAGPGLSLQSYTDQLVSIVGQLDAKTHEFALIARQVKR